MSFQQQHFEPTSTLAALCHQESTSYKCEDYLNSRAQSPTSSLMDQFFVQNNASASMTSEDVQVCINNRSKMAQWCMTLMDACQLNRETVSIAMNYLDRYLATKQGMGCIEDSATFQLASMTALYSAIKIHEEKAISPEVLSTISRGFYSAKDMEDMEVRMLNALQWRVNVPTPLAFVREYLAEMKTVDAATKDQLLSLAQVQTELAVADYNFVTVKPSSIGFAALVNAMDVLGLTMPSNNDIVETGLIDTNEVVQIQGALYIAVANLTHLRTIRKPVVDESQQTIVAPKRRQSHTISPRAVCEQ